MDEPMTLDKLHAILQADIDGIFAMRIVPRPSLAEVRAREAEGRRAWEQETEQIAATLPELLRDGFRLGRWMRWAGHVLLARASWAAQDDVEPNRATWARAHRLLEYADIVGGAAERWLQRQELLAWPTTLVIRGGKLEVPAPAPLPPAPPPPPTRPLTLERIAEAVGMIALTAPSPLSPTRDPRDRSFAQRLVDALTRRRRPVSRMLMVVAGQFATTDDLARTVKPESFLSKEDWPKAAEALRQASAQVDEELRRRLWP